MRSPSRTLAAALAALLLPATGLAQGHWRDVDEAAMRAALPPQRQSAAKRDIVPQAYRTLQLDLDAMRDRLAAAPPEAVGHIEEAHVEILLPLPYGGYGRFLVQDSPIMEPGLAAKYPEFKTYVAQGVDDPTATARIDLTDRGFRAMIMSGRGQFFIDPYWRDDTATYISYYKRHFKSDKTWRCHVDGRPIDLSKLNPLESGPPPRPNATGTTLRTFRVAIGATGEYTAAVSGTNPGTVRQALSAMITTMNRVSAMYERELAIRLVLVANTDLVIFTNALTDPYSDGDGAPLTLLNANAGVLNGAIGSANYDLGHVFSTNGGGVATLGCVCRTSKAEGVTGTNNPVQDPYDIDYVAHEMGHQFSGNHTFNTTETDCTAQRAATAAYEPGSGTTIMAYAGICPLQDVADHSDDYFHAKSREEIETYITSGQGTCGVQSATGNTLPSVAALTNYTIPSQTPFALTASATDANGDNLTYCWEQYNLANDPQDPSADPRDNGNPLFRSFDPSPSPTRVFPSLTYILNNANVPPPVIATSPLTIVSAEFLPTTSRTMTFRVTVRDNRLNGGGANFQSVNVVSVANAGPFAITEPINSGSSITAGNNLNVGWNVAGTTANGINCANVNILLSTDGGLTFPITLASGVPNNGSANVLIPNVAQVATTQGRIKVEGAGNIFFDINNSNLTITATNAPPPLNVTGSITVARGSASATSAVVGRSVDSQQQRVVVTPTLRDVPADVTASASQDAAGNISISAQANCTIVTTTVSRTYPISLIVTDVVGSTRSATVNLVITPNPAPSIGTYPNSIVPRSTVRVITPSVGLSDANGNLVVSPYTISPAVLPGGGTLTINQSTGAVTVTTTAASTMATTAVRISVADSCGATTVREFTVTVPAAAVTLAATAAGSTPSAESCLPPNGAVDPGETVTFSFPIANNGGTATTNALTATLQASGGVTPVGGNSKVYGVIPGGTTATQDFTFTAAGSCGGTITATLALQDGATNYGNVTFVIPLGVVNAVNTPLQSFDGATTPTLPAGWVSTVVSGSMTGFVTFASTAAHEGPNYVRILPVASASQAHLTSPAVAIPAVGTTQLKFFHRWITQLNADGTVLEISINGGAYADIVTAGGSFVSGGYNSTINSGSSALNNRAAWSGSAGAVYIPTVVNLPPAAAGNNVNFRWRIATNSTNSPSAGVYRLDTISLVTSTAACTNCQVAPQFTSALPPSQATVGSAYSHTFTVSGSPASSFDLRSGVLPPGLSLASNGVLSGTPTSAGTGVFADLVVRASNGVAPNAQQTFNLFVRTSAPNYLASFGLSGGAAALTADPNGDGVPNLLAYGLGLNPTAASAHLLPVVAIKDYAGTPYAYITFNRSSVATDLTYSVEASGDLQNWSTIATSSGGAATTGPGFVAETGAAPTFNVEVRDTVPALPGVDRYLRLRVATP